MTRTTAAWGLLTALSATIFFIAAPPPAWSVRPDADVSALPADDPYALGLKAFDAEDWEV